ncbi:MAG: response regulator transcription factor [Chloroflexi bacterium]|nr:response regulator transcription factor [Chloroflexota bacterium]
MIHLISVLVADDHGIVREGSRAVINAERDMEMVGEAADGEEAVQLALKLKPDVILMDLFMPRKNGIEAIREIKRANPQARILVLTSYSDEALVLSAIQAGALGYLLKDTSAAELPEAIRCIYRGEPSVDPAIARKLVLSIGKGQGAEPDVNALTEREVEVVKLIAHGLANQAIADRLCIAERTVRFHVGNILAKLQLENRTEVALFALRTGLVRTGD